MKSTIEFLNPDELLKNPAFSQIAVTNGTGATIYIGGQNAITKDLTIVGKGDIAAQTEYILNNIEIALRSCKSSLDDLLKPDHLHCAGSGCTERISGSAGISEEAKTSPGNHRGCRCRPGKSGIPR